MEPLGTSATTTPSATSAPTATALVVTGASDGIGPALAVAFARDAEAILLLGRDGHRLDATASAVRAQTSAPVVTLSLDLTRPDAIEVLDTALAQHNWRIGMLINSAGIGLAGPFADQPAGNIDDLVALNIGALTRLTRRALDDMRLARRGSIINLSSLGAYAPGPSQAVYYASKAYVLSLSEALAHECRAESIHVMAVVPGPVRTSFHTRMGSDSAWYLKLMPVPSPETVARYVRVGHKLGLRVVAPGLSTMLLLPLMKVVPHRLLMPIMSILLTPRR
jgi:uncharacterized protein